MPDCAAPKRIAKRGFVVEVQSHACEWFSAPAGKKRGAPPYRHSYTVARVCCGRAPYDAPPKSPNCPTRLFFLFAKLVSYQALFPRSYRLVITVILQDHPGLLEGTVRCSLIVDPRKCGYAHNPPRCVSTTHILYQRDQPATGLQSHTSLFFSLSTFCTRPRPWTWSFG